MSWIALACGILIVTGIVSVLTCRVRPRFGFYVGMSGSLAGCVIGFGLAAFRLLSGETIPAMSLWSLPLGEIRVGLDALSAFFLFCICLVSGLAALYGFGYLRKDIGSSRLGPATLFFNLLVASMIGVVLAGDAISFLMSWEMMSLFSFFLVGYDHERAEVRRAGFIYLAASHISVILIFVLFALLAKAAGTFRFDVFALSHPSETRVLSTCFLLALFGFGTKAGFWMLHIWLPEAHPAVPSHVSAVMSGVMIKLGIYGLLRVLTFLGPPPPWWGILLVTIGILSGLSGVIQALGQHDLKRLLAYHSIENIGIIALGVGVGMLGASFNEPGIAFLGYSGAILHVLNHGLFKGLLFQGAGSVLKETGTRNCEALGGLLKKMPITGSTFLVGCAAISGFPPLNGFVSEWLIYVGLFYGAFRFHGPATGACISGIVSLAFIGGLAAACFAKAFGIVFLGNPRSKLPHRIQDPGRAMRISMLAGAVLCFGIGLWPRGAISLVSWPAGVLAGTALIPPGVLSSLDAITRAAFFLLALAALATYVRHKLLVGREVRSAVTWGCGYDAPSPRMQYTASSFAQPLLQSVGTVLKRTRRVVLPQGYFPTSGHFTEHLVDRSLEHFWVPAAVRTTSLFRRLKFLQQGRLQSYLLYILVTLILFLLWKVR